MADKILYLVDASPYIFRAWFGMPDVFFNEQQQPVNAIYGFGLFIRDFLTRFQPKYAVFAFDESLESGFRHRLYPAYKANRGLPDEALEYQLKACRALAENTGFRCLASDNYEADDLIGSLAFQAKKQQLDIVIHSTDKDLSQLVSANCCVDPFYNDDRIDLDSFEKSYGFTPAFLADYLALAGDAVDNIPGISGIGKKTAQNLIRYFGKLEHIYSALASTETVAGIRGFASVKKKLLAAQADAFLFRELTRIHLDATVPATLEQWQVNPAATDALATLLVEWSLEKRLQSLTKLLS